MGYFGVSTPVKIVGAFLAVGIGYWVYRSSLEETGYWQPDPWKAAVFVLASFLIVIGVTWLLNEVATDRSRYDFVVVPHDDAFVFESLAPQADTEIFPGPNHEYGARLTVLCQTVDSKGNVWFQLSNRNFMSAKDLQPAPLEESQPPAC